jgi:hypothetical protein
MCIILNLIYKPSTRSVKQIRDPTMNRKEKEMFLGYVTQQALQYQFLPQIRTEKQ